MPSADGPRGPHDQPAEKLPQSQTIEFQLFESLVHHLIEKGLLTRNDALSVVQTVAEVKRGQLEEPRAGASVHNELAALQQLYVSIELIAERPFDSSDGHDGNVLQLRPPIHGDKPRFPRGD